MLSIKNDKVIQFYKTHSYINFETANILLVELLEKLLQKQDGKREDVLLSYLKKIDTEFNSVCSSVTDLKENVKQSSLSIVNLQTTLSNIPTTMTDNLTSRLTTLRENQVKELERVLQTNNHNNVEHIDKKLKTELMQQIKVLFDSNMNERLQLSLSEFEKNLKQEWQSTMREMEKSDSPKNIIENFNSNLQIKCDSLQQFILQCHDQIKNTTNSHTETLNLVQTHFDRQKNSTFKGKDSENRVEDGLNAAFPDCQIINTTGISKSGDFLIERSNKTTIMIENKDYKGNVPKDEIEKFIRDIEEQSCNGILVSQKSGIARKKNFQIDIHNGYIIVFIHHLQFDFDKLRLAVDTIDHLSNCLKDFGADSVDFKLSSETLKEINKEYLTFITQKNAISEALKKYNRDTTKIINEMQFPQLSNILSQHFTSTEETLFKCEYCKCKVFKSSKALAKHVTTCKKNINKVLVVENSDENTD